MAITTIKEKTSLRLELDGGIVDGKQKIHPKSFTQIKTTAEDQDLYNAAAAIAGLQDKNLLKVQRVETTTLIE
ncbi:DUF1659 domain-containing protein [Tissierella sp. MB52-C2]|uniref:DUF1659 domain-containing protein n=1 Tax=Tissierella sp. MB52-C2 TaxID=3070999 RepID=UPI00280BFABE|nr:DUF1659 domain-containing protein [Tissierella sp. MB52-C2]WMM24304.1 DUF1659 domain-containing protein [Tissierella sp. MB52-C2]